MCYNDGYKLLYDTEYQWTVPIKIYAPPKTRKWAIQRVGNGQQNHFLKHQGVSKWLQSLLFMI